MCFVKMKIGHNHHFKNLKLKDINADDLLVILIARDHQTLIPNGEYRNIRRRFTCFSRKAI